jgi:hypothetical protein
MAKGQLRSNKEIKKPKAKKVVTPLATSNLLKSSSTGVPSKKR